MHNTKLEIKNGLNIVIDSEVPESSGLGSSASFATSLVGALYNFIT
jgi:mevalonate kinase